MNDYPKAMSEAEALELYHSLPKTKEHKETRKTLAQLLNIKESSE